MKKAKEILYEYRMFIKMYSYRKFLPLILKNMFIICLLSDLFYDNLAYSLLLFPGLVILIWQDMKKIKEKTSENCMRQFQDMLSLLSQDLQAGNAVENAFVHAEKELTKLYSAESDFMRALQHLVYGLHINIPVEKLVHTLAEEVDREDIRIFAFVFSAAKRSGGNMVETVAFCSNTLIEKIRLNREMENIVSAKKMEQRLMRFIPMGILLYVKLCCGDFISALYHNLSGNIIMSVFLLVYAFAYVWSNSIVDIKV